MGSRESFVTTLQQLILAPIAAVIRADYMAARQFVELLRQFGFVPPPGAKDDYLGELRMVRFSYEQVDQNGNPTVRVFSVPAISLIPLPLLEVKDATFEFGVHLLSRETEPSPEPPPTGDAQDLEPNPSRHHWRAIIARGSATRSSSNTGIDLSPHIEANLDAKIVVGQAGIPAGIANLLALVGENAQVSQPILSVIPAVFKVTDPRVPISIVIRAQSLWRGERVGVKAIYEPTDDFILQAEGRIWLSGETLLIGENGLLSALVQFRENAINRRATICFVTDVADLTSSAIFKTYHP